MAEFNVKDISLVIPTYNRPKEVSKTLKTLGKNEKLLGEILIIDQSKDNETRKVVSKYSGVKYYHIDKAGLTLARNYGVKKISKRCKIVLFSDDDVDFSKSYFDEIVKVFNEKNAYGVGGYVLPNYSDIPSKYINLLKNVFRLSGFTEDKADVVSAYGNRYPIKLDKVIEAEWLPGVNMAYRREVSGKEKFDENFFGYCLAEDFDFSYRVSKRYGGLFITPHAKIIHRFTATERIPNKKAVYMNQINHLYINFKSFDGNLWEKAVFFWVVGGLTLLKIGQFAVKRDKNAAINLRLFLGSLVHCLINLGKIRKGDLRIVE